MPIITEQPVDKGRRGHLTKSLLGVIGLAIAAELVFIPLLNMDHTKKVLSAFDGNIEECAGSEKLQDSKFPYDAIFVLGGGAIKTGKGVYELSDPSKLRFKATAKAYKDGWSDRIFIMYGEMGQGEEHIAVDYLQSEYNRLTNGKQVIPNEKIHVENKSRTTNQNIEAIMEIIAEFGIKSPVLITDEKHMSRAKNKACENFFTSSATAEDIINGYSPSRAESIRTIQRSKILSDREKREILLLLLKIWDDEGMVIEILNKIEGPYWR